MDGLSGHPSWTLDYLFKLGAFVLWLFQTQESDPLSSPSRRRAFGLLVRREQWALSRIGRVVILFSLLGAVVLLHWVACPFLAVTHPLRGEVLVLEGWLPMHSLARAAIEFTKCPIAGF